jgi:hypothetical protein
MCQVAQDVEPALAHGLERNMSGFEVPAGLSSDLAEQSAPELVALEDPVPRGAAHGTDRASARERIARDYIDDPVVDFVASHCCAI